MFNRFNTNKCKTQAKLCIGRVRLMRNKRQIAMKQMRREVADLLRANKQENARIRVEAVIREQNLLQAYEVLEIFLELLTVRLQMVEKSVDIPNDMFECLSSLVYSASRIQDFPELICIRGMLGHKFGKEFIEKAHSDKTCRQFMVNENLIRCLAIGAPDPEVKLALLSDIAQEHGVEWDSHRAHQEMITGGGAQRGYAGSESSFPGSPPSNPGPPPGNFGGGSGAGGGGNMPFGAPPSPIFVPPPGEPVSPFGAAPAPSPQGQSKLKNILKKVPTLGRSSPSHPQQTDSFGLPHGNEGWKDAQSAAAAARGYSQRAQNAADAAQRYASSNASSDLGASEARTPPNVSPPPARPPPTAMPPNPDYPDIQMSGPPPPAINTFTPLSSYLPPVMPANQDAAALSGNAGAQPKLPPGQYRQRSDEEIQQAYDAAVGPPVKRVGPPVKRVGPPSAPPAPDRDTSPRPARDGSLGLPSPPGVNGNSSSAAAKDGDGGIDEDLAARFEALKYR